MGREDEEKVFASFFAVDHQSDCTYYKNSLKRVQKRFE